MQDRVRIGGGNGKSSKLMCPGGYNPADFAAFLADLKAGIVYVDVTPNNSTGSDAGVTVIGTALNKANLLTDATAQGFGFDTSGSNDVTVNDVFERIGADYISGTLAAGQTSLVLTDERIKTTSKFDIYTSLWTSQPTEVTAANGSLTLTFDAQATAVSIDVRVY